MIISPIINFLLSFLQDNNIMNIYISNKFLSFFFSI
ncbi:hypothetical protein CHY_0028 [Carboxydothermus hydrogenoformans Z-2901]|uniref:Uncharacterized protein n=1 Tax=Carboxydothermus hydrogenoformans (strain ATCC BAA-161 / DSM 6008 / Z-2901) TaxID=246194 RepID=Q3AG34_CARHZ|nr:hypothetical protein CHY_0028 [Carboxydothermus hydrogenoformans Z-2901]